MRSLQCLRGVAALLVVYYHACLQSAGSGPYSIPGWAVFGDFGVDLFFVLSGFIIWTSSARKSLTPHVFMAKRLKRVAPLYWLLTIAAAALALLLPAFSRSTRFDLAHLVASLAFVPYPNPAPSVSGMLLPVIIPGWTLNFEMMFYLLFAISLYLGPQIRLVNFLSVILGAFVVFQVLALVFPIFAFYDPLLVVEFVLGVLVAQPRYPIARNAIGPLILLIVLCAAALVIFDSPAATAHRLFRFGFFSAAIIFCLIDIELSGRWPPTRFLERVGDASYSIYLSHIFVVAALRTSFQLVGLSLSWIFPFLSIAFATLVGLLTYRFIERPLAAGLKR